MIPEWPLFHDTREEADKCPACNPQVPDAAISPLAVSEPALELRERAGLGLADPSTERTLR